VEYFHQYATSSFLANLDVVILANPLVNFHDRLYRSQQRDDVSSYLYMCCVAMYHGATVDIVFFIVMEVVVLSICSRPQSIPYIPCKGNHQAWLYRIDGQKGSIPCALCKRIFISDLKKMYGCEECKWNVCERIVGNVSDTVMRTKNV
jgi:hypothetical protein